MLCHSSELQSNSTSLLDDSSLVPEWSWLHGLAVTVKAADALTYRREFPQGFSVPDEDGLESEMAYRPTVCFSHGNLKLVCEITSEIESIDT